MKLIQEFKQFAIKGNAVDLAVGIIIGASFNSVVQSLVKDVVMPPIGYILKRIDFSELYVNLGPDDYSSLSEASLAGAPTINYGLFINVTVTFLITAVVIFFVVKYINILRRKDDAEPVVTPSKKRCVYCDSEISIKATRCPLCTSELLD